MIQAQLKWTDGLQFVGRAGKSPGIILDNAEGGSGPSPMQLVLIGVAGCTAMDVISIMQKKRVKVTEFSVNISGNRASQHPKRYETIQIEYVLKGTAIKPTAVEQAIQLSQTKYCSATASLNATISHTYQIIDEPA